MRWESHSVGRSIWWAVEQIAALARLLADVLHCPVQVVAAPGDAAARGAALIAGRSLGWYTDFAPGEQFFPLAQTYQPNGDAGRRYDAFYAIFRTLYGQLRGAFADLAQLAAE